MKNTIIRTKLGTNNFYDSVPLVIPASSVGTQFSQVVGNSGNSINNPSPLTPYLNLQEVNNRGEIIYRPFRIHLNGTFNGSGSDHVSFAITSSTAPYPGPVSSPNQTCFFNSAAVNGGGGSFFYLLDVFPIAAQPQSLSNPIENAFITGTYFNIDGSIGSAYWSFGEPSTALINDTMQLAFAVNINYPYGPTVDSTLAIENLEVSWLE